MTPDLQSFPPKRRKTARWIVGLFLGYIVLGFLVLPPIVRRVAVKQISQQLDRNVSIEKVKLNPLTLSATIRGLLIKDKDGQPFVSWDEVYVNFQLSSFLGHPWVFKEVSATRPLIRVQMNKDYTFNFSDLITKFATNPSPPGAQPSRPLALHIDHLCISNATADLTDLTPRTPFKRILGPLNINLENFRTDPDNKNPYSFTGTTDAGEKLAWQGHFYLDPIRSQGDLSVDNFSLAKYAPLYQDLVRFEVKDGAVDIHSTYRFEWSASNHLASVTNTSFALHSLKLGQPNNETNLLELREFSVSGASLDISKRDAEVASISVAGAKIFVQRDKDNAINLVEAAKPNEGAGVPGGIQLLLRSVTNAIAILLNSTNEWEATLDEVKVTDCSVNFADFVNSRPALLTLDDITLTARNISNLPGTNLTASLSLRWNTNGSIKADSTISFRPTTADVKIALNDLELGPLDPYLEPMLNVFVLSSKLSVTGLGRFQTSTNDLPDITFQGDVQLNDFSTVDGTAGEDLLKWGSVRLSGIDVDLSPPKVVIKEIALDDIVARLLIETNHTINLLTALRLTETNAPVDGKDLAQKEAPEKKSTAGPPSELTTNTTAGLSLPDISVDRVVISNAAVRFTDRSLSPNVNLTVQQAGGTIAGLSSKEPRHAEVDFHAKIDNIGTVEVGGTINPFSGESTNELKATVKNVDLTPVSSYSGKYAGYRIARGKLGLALTYHLIGRDLKSENLITLDQFAFGDSVDSPEATKMPVRLGVALLKDRNGKIELDVPVEGNLDDPDFEFHKAIGHAIGNILTRIVTSPFSLVGSVFGGNGEEIRYEDFAPASSALLLIDTEKLDALVKGLYQRPGLDLEIEGSVNPEADREGLRRLELDKQLRTAKWQSLHKSARASTTPDQISLTAEERPGLVKKLYGQELENGKLDLAKLSANANTAVLAEQLRARRHRAKRGGTLLMTPPPKPGAGPGVSASSALPPVTDPLELALLTTMPVTDNDLEALASDRAKAVRAYIVQTGQVAAERLFLVEAQPGGVKTDGARTYLQFR